MTSASAEYERLWRSDGGRIVAKLVALTGLRFSEGRLDAVVHEGPSRSHPLRLRASYDRDTKRGTLIHELAHRLIAGSIPRTQGSAASERESHELIYAFLFDAWSDLYGEAFAHRQVQVESLRRPVYAEAWQVALSKDRPARAAARRDALTGAPRSAGDR